MVIASHSVASYIVSHQLIWQIRKKMNWVNVVRIIDWNWFNPGIVFGHKISVHQLNKSTFEWIMIGLVYFLTLKMVRLDLRANVIELQNCLHLIASLCKIRYNAQIWWVHEVAHRKSGERRRVCKKRHSLKFMSWFMTTVPKSPWIICAIQLFTHQMKYEHCFWWWTFSILNHFSWYV